MRAALPAAAIGLMLALFAPATRPKEGKEGPLTKEQIERDLRLVAAPLTPRVIEAGNQAHIGLKLVNTSRTRTHKVVKPGDGSEVGWRDPWVHVTAEQRTTAGEWVPMERFLGTRCGHYDRDWPRDAVELKPGEELALSEWYHPGEAEFQWPGRVRLVGHYEYRATRGYGGEPRPDAERGGMAGVPLFALRSEPVEFEVVRPLDVRARVKRAMKAGAESKASDIIEVTVTNTSDRPREVGNASQDDYRIGITPDSEVVRPAGAFSDVPAHSSVKTLRPGETVAVFGGGDFASKADGLWKGRKPGKARVRVSYGVKIGGSARQFVRAEEVEVQVVE